MTAETGPETIARLLKGGGTVLVVGGGVSKLPLEYRDNAQIILWDDEVGGFNGKDVPSNVRAIIFNRWISHSTAGRLRSASASMRIPIFPMQSTRELKDKLSSLIHEIEKPESITETPEPETKSEPVTTDLESGIEMKKPVKGGLIEFAMKHLNASAATNIIEAKRLLKLFKEEGYTSTIGSMAQAVRVAKLRLGVKPSEQSLRASAVSRQQHIDRGHTPGGKKGKKDKIVSSSPTGQLDTDLEEAMKLLENAKSALDLVVEFIPRLQLEVQKQRDKIMWLREVLE